MMEETGAIGTLLAVFILLTSYKGFQDKDFEEENIFDVDRILLDKEYRRMLTSGFLHANWYHLLFNLVGLLSFSAEIEALFGPWKFLLLYFTSLIGGNLLALYVHRNHGDYRALGASGAISGVIFASIILDPGGSISFIFIPIQFKAWWIGVAFVLFSIFGIKSQKDNIGHEAHLGGAIVGMLLTVILYPIILQMHLWVFALLFIPSVLFIILIVRKPEVLLISNYFGKEFNKVKDRVRYEQMKADEVPDPEDELNRILEKIGKKGMESLTAYEIQFLNEHSS